MNAVEVAFNSVTGKCRYAASSENLIIIDDMEFWVIQVNPTRALAKRCYQVDLPNPGRILLDGTEAKSEFVLVLPPGGGH
jgi:hypothetical protein